MACIISKQLKMDTLTVQAGIGETIKERNTNCTVMPSEYDIAVETYVNPLDLPLISKGAKIKRIWFDGWPTIVFQVGQCMSYGTFGVEFAVEKFISDNGKFRC
jgi:hypothetical protein